jgi:hypothetical protein
MAQSYKRSLLVALVALIPLFTACERMDDLSGVSEVGTPPAVTTDAKPKYATLVGRVDDSEVANHVAYVKVNPKRKARLQIGKYVLEIPNGAVTRPTTFRMTVPNNGYIAVELEAWDNFGNPVHTFQQQLKLTLPYEDADLSMVDNLSDLVFANTENGQILECVGTSVDEDRKTVTGQISHFSMWALAKEISMGID